jgi:deoxycytidine triphosphate deaminase
MNKKLMTLDGKEIKEEDIFPGMLSSPQIYYYVLRYKIIENFDLKYLKSAIYQMRLGSFAVRWEDSKEINFKLGDIENKEEGVVTNLVFKPNSLTFVTTIEKFNLRKDIIARFNLKSKWILKGLLLGTGPIVDPEFNSNLCIPIHNFSNQPIKVRYG